MLLCVFWQGLRGSRYRSLGPTAQAMLQVSEQMPDSLLKTLLDLLFQPTDSKSVQVPNSRYYYVFHTNYAGYWRKKRRKRRK